MTSPFNPLRTPLQRDARRRRLIALLVKGPDGKGRPICPNGCEPMTPIRSGFSLWECGNCGRVRGPEGRHP